MCTIKKGILYPTMQFTQLKVQVLNIPGLKIQNNFNVQDNWIALTELNLYLINVTKMSCRIMYALKKQKRTYTVLHSGIPC